MTTTSLDTATTRPLWWEGLDDQLGARDPLPTDLDVDVAIVGAGYTGLWTAYSLAVADPSLRIAVLERAHVGFGASGRNGGWCYDGFAAGSRPAREDVGPGDDAGVCRRVARDGRRDRQGGRRTKASTATSTKAAPSSTSATKANACALKRMSQRHGVTAGPRKSFVSSPPPKTREIGNSPHLVGGLWSAHTAAIQPAKLALGLAEAAERRGVAIYEHTAVTKITPGRVTTASGAVVKSRVIVRATEGYTADLVGHHRTLAPLYSMMIATEPLPDAMWDDIGLADRQTFGDLRHLVIYGQRTADGRIAFGGRGAPYDYGSRIRSNADFPAETFAPVREALIEVFPQLSDVAITHRWGGVLGVSAHLAPDRRPRPSHGHRMGRRVRWFRRRRHQPRRPHPRRPHHRRRPAHAIPLGQPASATGSRSRCAGSGSTPRSSDDSADAAEPRRTSRQVPTGCGVVKI